MRECSLAGNNIVKAPPKNSILRPESEFSHESETGNFVKVCPLFFFYLRREGNCAK